MTDVLRHASNSDGVHDGITVGNLSLDFDSYRVILNGDTVAFTAREFDLLRALSMQAGRVVPFGELAGAVLGASDRRAIRHLNVLVHRMRAKLAGLHPYSLETVRLRGYGLIGPPESGIFAGADAPAGACVVLDAPATSSWRRDF